MPVDTESEGQKAPLVRRVRDDAGQREENLEKLLLTVEEAAHVMGIGRTKMFELIAAGAVESVRIGASRRVPSAAIAEYVDHLRSRAGVRTSLAMHGVESDLEAKNAPSRPA